MEKSQLSITKERKIEDNSITDVHKQGVDKGEALLSLDATKVYP